MILSPTKALPDHFLILLSNFIIREETAEPFCFPMQWILSRGQKKTGISWLASILLLMFIVAIAVKCWVGSMKELMKHPRSTRKESSYLKSQKLLRRTGSIPFCSPFYSFRSSCWFVHVLWLSSCTGCSYLQPFEICHCFSYFIVVPHVMTRSEIVR